MQIITLSEKEFDDFSKKHELSSFYQTSMYGNSVIDEYNLHYIGLIENNILIGASLILYKKLFLGFKYAYAPRGILLNYTNKDLVKKFTFELKHLLLKQGFFYIKIDPLIIVNERDIKGNILKSNNNTKIIMENLISAGFIYKGDNKYFENFKARFEAIVSLSKRNLLFSSFKKNHKNKIRRSLKYGVEVHEDKEKDIIKVYPLIKRKYNKDLNFYKKMIECFKDNIKIYNIYINPTTCVINSKFLYEKELEKNEQLNNMIIKYKNKTINKLITKKMNSDLLLNNYKKVLISSTKLLENKTEGFLIGTSIVLTYKNNVYLLIESFDKKYSNFYPTYLLKWRIIEEYSNLNFKDFNLNAITGDFSKINKFSGLNEMKLGFSSSINEYIGEFDYIINKFIYFLYIFYKKMLTFLNKKSTH